MTIYEDHAPFLAHRMTKKRILSNNKGTRTKIKSMIKKLKKFIKI